MLLLPYSSPAFPALLPSCLFADKSKSVVRLRNVMMELRKLVNHPCLAAVELATPAYAAAVARRQAAAAAAAKAAAEGERDGCFICVRVT